MEKKSSIIITSLILLSRIEVTPIRHVSRIDSLLTPVKAYLTITVSEIDIQKSHNLEKIITLPIVLSLIKLAPIQRMDILKSYGFFTHASKSVHYHYRF